MLAPIPSPPSERAIVFCVGAVQFVNILDFMIVMPLGPDFASALGIPLSHIGYVGFVRVPPELPVMGIFVLFMLGMAFRNVAYNTLTTKVPDPEERARFSSIQSAVQHFAAAVGAFASAQFLSELPDHKLIGVQNTAYAAIALSCCLLPFMWAVERRVLRR